MYPEEVGGSGAPFPYTCYTVLCEELARGSMGFAAGVCMQGSTATHTLHAWGGDEVRSAGYARRCAGEKVGAFAITEPNAGSDAASLRTRARRGPTAAGYSTAARSSRPTARSRTSSPWSRPWTRVAGPPRGSNSSSSTPTSRGFGIGRKLDKVSVRCSDTAELTFDDVFVPDNHCLGDGQVAASCGPISR